MRISLLTLTMALFYFICWTPFWFSTLYAVYLEHRSNGNNTALPPVFVYFMYFIHALPFTNSAINWILYGLLNHQLHGEKTDLSYMKNHLDQTDGSNSHIILMQQKKSLLSANQIPEVIS